MKTQVSTIKNGKTEARQNEASLTKYAFCDSSLVNLNDLAEVQFSDTLRNVALTKRYYLSEFELFDGDHFITFNIVDINTVRKEITVAVSNEGKISVCTYDLRSDGERIFFEYGMFYEKIAVDDFEQVEED